MILLHYALPIEIDNPTPIDPVESSLRKYRNKCQKTEQSSRRGSRPQTVTLHLSDGLGQVATGAWSDVTLAD
ncbi:unnamed protein product [Leptosia nina]|uniref:Uncharacterized protein n=1 Tax=Leptosia nina TaxID=320188 RepID=A0AAV1JTF5_9NEOP